MKYLFPFSLSRLTFPACLVVAVLSAPVVQSQEGVGASTPQSLKDVMSQTSLALPNSSRVDEERTQQEDAGSEMRRQLLQKLVGHPKLDEARANVCTAGFQIRLNKAAYYPKLSVSLSAGEKLVDKTTRADEFGGVNSPEYDGDGVNATLQLRQQIYDWGNTAASIDLAKLQRNQALLERLVVLDEQAAAILRAALDYQAQAQVLSHYQEISDNFEQTLIGIEARFEAGAGTLVELRQAQILKLEHEAAVDTAMRRRDQSIEILQRQYTMMPEDADAITNIFLAHRPVVPETILAEVSLQGRIIALELQATEYENNQLNAQRLPKVEGVLMGRAWDINESNSCGGVLDPAHPDAINRGGAFDPDYRRGQNCSTHEVVGSFEFTMPLYDGGANKAQRGEVSSRRTSLEHKRLAFIREHESESNFVRRQLTEYATRYRLQKQQLIRMTAQLESLQAVQGKSQSNPLEVARLQSRHAALQADLILLQFQIENVRLEMLLRANQLSSTLGIELESPGC